MPPQDRPQIVESTRVAVIIFVTYFWWSKVMTACDSMFDLVASEAIFAGAKISECMLTYREER